MAVQYQDFLLEEFRSRRGRNPQYSLRAFARDLGMPASKLSQNLRGLCGISVAKAEKIAGRLQMRDDEKALFLALVESQHARSRVARAQAEASLTKIREENLDVISLEKFSAVRDWYHFAILQLVDVKGFRADAGWVAERLGVSVDLINDAVRRLTTLGLLSTEDGQWINTQKDLELPGGIPSRTVREHHRQIITKAMLALDHVPMEAREFGSLTFAVDHTLLPEMKTLIRDFQLKLNKLSHQGIKTSVYALSMQLFPLAEGDDE